MRAIDWAVMACILGLVAWKLHDLRHDQNQTEAKRHEMARKVSEQGELTNELAGILRRLGVRVGRLEEKNTTGE